MSNITSLYNFSIYMQYSDDKAAATKVVPAFISLFFSGNQAVFGNVDSCVSSELPMAHPWHCPDHGDQRMALYPLNRASLAGWLRTSGFLNGVPTITEEMRGEELYHALSRKYDSEDISVNETMFFGNIVVKNIVFIKFLNFRNITPPEPWLTVLRGKSSEIGKAGRKPGMKISKDLCCDCLDQLIKMGIYSPIERGAPTAARLIQNIYETGLTEGGIQRDIETYHQQLLRKKAPRKT